MNTTEIGYLALFANSCLATLRPVFFKSVDYNIINTLFISAIAFFLFSAGYIAYKYFTDKTYFKINDKTTPNILGLTANPIENIFNPKMFGISILSQIQFISQYCSYLFLPVSIAIPLGSLGIFSVLFYSHYLNKTNIVLMDYIASIISLFGVIILNWNKIWNNSTEAKSINSMSYMIGLGLIFVSIIVSGYVFVINKDITDILTPMQTMLNDSTGAVIFMSIVWIIYALIPAKTFKQTFPTIKQTFPSITQTIYAFLFFFIVSNAALIFRFIGLDYLPEITAGLLLNVSVIISLFYGKVFFNEELTMTKIIGALVIILSVIMISVKDRPRVKSLTSHIDHLI